MSRIAPASLAVNAAAALVAVFLTAIQLGAVEVLSQQRRLSAHATVVQLDRVVVTGQRGRTQALAAEPRNACLAAEVTAC